MNMLINIIYLILICCMANASVLRKELKRISACKSIKLKTVAFDDIEYTINNNIIKTEEKYSFCIDQLNILIRQYDIYEKAISLVVLKEYFTIRKTIVGDLFAIQSHCHITRKALINLYLDSKDKLDCIFKISKIRFKQFKIIKENYTMLIERNVDQVKLVKDLLTTLFESALNDFYNDWEISDRNISLYKDTDKILANNRRLKLLMNEVINNYDNFTYSKIDIACLKYIGCILKYNPNNINYLIYGVIEFNEIKLEDFKINESPKTIYVFIHLDNNSKINVVYLNWIIKHDNKSYLILSYEDYISKELTYNDILNVRKSNEIISNNKLIIDYVKYFNNRKYMEPFERTYLKDHQPISLTNKHYCKEEYVVSSSKNILTIAYNITQQVKVRFVG